MARIADFVDEIREGGIRVLLKKFRESIVFKILSALLVLGIIGIIAAIVGSLMAKDEAVKPVYYSLPKIEVLANQKYYDPENNQIQPQKVYITIKLGIVYKNDPKMQETLENIESSVVSEIQKYIQDADPREIAYYELRTKEGGLLDTVTEIVRQRVAHPEWIYESFVIQHILTRENIAY